jgi:hypothetical protein
MFDYFFEFNFDVNAQDTAMWFNVVSTRGWLEYIHCLNFKKPHQTKWQEILVLL